MRIRTLDLTANTPELCDLDVPLRRLAASPEPLTAARWQKLRELVQRLGVDGPYSEAWGQVLCDELYLYPPGAANGVTVRASADWYDYAPLEAGRPVMHYRLRVQRQGAEFTEDVRTQRLEEADRMIREAFG
jgi:hypothetical protein